jgi:thioredoxin-like negative regulator of GroEL
MFKDGKLVDRMVGYPGGANPIREWIERHVPTVAADVKTSA